MAHAHKVMKSLESPCGLRCVDIVIEPESSRHGWAAFRRDPEDSHGWRPDGYGATGFDSFEAALRDARATLTWLEAS